MRALTSREDIAQALNMMNMQKHKANGKEN